MSYIELAADLRSAIEQQDTAAIRHLVAEMQLADLAEFIQHEQEDTTLSLLDYLPLDERASAFGYLEEETQSALAAEMDDATLAELLHHMSADERADLFKLLDEARQQGLLRRLAHAEREDIRKLASYEEGTAGALMTSEYVAVPAEMDVATALEKVRRTGPNAETIYQIYCVDDEGRLTGTLSLREMILANPRATLASLMVEELVVAKVDTPQEEVARLISRYDLMALPVTNGGERLVGIVTYDDAMDVAEEEATEDMHKSVSVGKLEGGLRSASLFDLYRKRIVWLVLLVFANIFSGAGIAYFEETIEAYIALVFFLPLLVDSGGNAGSQAATLMVRGMATGDVRTRDWARLLGREVSVAIALGLTMALAVSVVGIFRAGTEIAMVVAMSMVLIVIMGSLIGMILPFLLNRLGWDPATASAPLVTSIADAVGVLIYFAIATAVLGLPA
ncbi:magnesium transporter [Halomonas sp. JS92-SW72]|uniref:magnesium transporter n=1 Tax=Halomonas sp. JS92-SW72 TaxID=2306583 RepID=UPI000E5A7064|nr:magnesium transporter [Halomonas sp. JS92-SW72]AXY43375.1 magnesium transporter [Halomonas sp. JS92-SW72]